jgi:ArsR family transcriptional regulator
MQDSTEDLLQRLKALGDLTRLRLVALCRQGECSVSELTQVLGQSQPRISQQLKLLCEARLLRRFRDGKRVFYRVPASGRQGEELSELLELIPAQDPLFVEDVKELRRVRGEISGEPAADEELRLADREIHKAPSCLRAARVVPSASTSMQKRAAWRGQTCCWPDCRTAVCAKAICIACHSMMRNSIR